MCLAAILVIIIAFFALKPFANNPSQWLERYITRVLTVPNTDVQDVLNLENADQETFDTAYRQAMEALAGDEATESMVESLIQLSSIGAFHFEAIQRGFTVTPEETTVTLNSASDMIYDYAATATITDSSAKDFSVILTGRVQLSQDGKVRYMDINYDNVLDEILH